MGNLRYSVEVEDNRNLPRFDCIEARYRIALPMVRYRSSVSYRPPHVQVQKLGIVSPSPWSGTEARYRIDPPEIWETKLIDGGRGSDSARRERAVITQQGEGSGYVSVRYKETGA
ncbi:hypothetical protein RRG08_047133 [Elysia crispata]|uniref:Uncharacterized protein n=1 Tax=Elysia crispata TaxID=231223 RepID=A0AAE1ANQ6_9GAST|nr:hypothetical protein RRG08_047133 [Elysia crispata]